MKDAIIKFRLFLIKHVKNKKLQTLIWGLISYEMLSYMLFGVGTIVVDGSAFIFFHALGLDELLSNIISTSFAIVFAYITNKLWVFKSKTHGFVDVLEEFFKFARVRIGTLVMTEIILLVSKLIHGNAYIAKLIAMILTVIMNYVFSKLFIFNNGKVNDNDKKKS